jgi:hypothetical protein
MMDVTNHLGMLIYVRTEIVLIYDFSIHINNIYMKNQYNRNKFILTYTYYSHERRDIYVQYIIRRSEIINVRSVVR